MVLFSQLLLTLSKRDGNKELVDASVTRGWDAILLNLRTMYANQNIISTDNTRSAEQREKDELGLYPNQVSVWKSTQRQNCTIMGSNIRREMKRLLNSFRWRMKPYNNNGIRHTLTEWNEYRTPKNETLESNIRWRNGMNINRQRMKPYNLIEIVLN